MFIGACTGGAESDYHDERIDGCTHLESAGGRLDGVQPLPVTLAGTRVAAWCTLGKVRDAVGTPALPVDIERRLVNEECCLRNRYGLGAGNLWK